MKGGGSPVACTRECVELPTQFQDIPDNVLMKIYEDASTENTWKLLQAELLFNFFNVNEEKGRRLKAISEVKAKLKKTLLEDIEEKLKEINIQHIRVHLYHNNSIFNSSRLKKQIKDAIAPFQSKYNALAEDVQEKSKADELSVNKNGFRINIKDNNAANVIVKLFEDTNIPIYSIYLVNKEKDIKFNYPEFYKVQNNKMKQDVHNEFCKAIFGVTLDEFNVDTFIGEFKHSKINHAKLVKKIQGETKSFYDYEIFMSSMQVLHDIKVAMNNKDIEKLADIIRF